MQIYRIAEMQCSERGISKRLIEVSALWVIHQEAVAFALAPLVPQPSFLRWEGSAPLEFAGVTPCPEAADRGRVDVEVGTEVEAAVSTELLIVVLCLVQVPGMERIDTDIVSMRFMREPSLAMGAAMREMCVGRYLELTHSLKHVRVVHSVHDAMQFPSAYILHRFWTNTSFARHVLLDGYFGSTCVRIFLLLLGRSGAIRVRLVLKVRKLVEPTLLSAGGIVAEMVDDVVDDGVPRLLPSIGRSQW
jgi:hypothetical protein